MKRIQQPNVAGTFYPGDPDQLAADIHSYLDATPPTVGQAPKALIAPHAGYIYSGPVAASAYARLRANADSVERVVLLAPAHRLPFSGLATSSATHFRTPLGDIPVDVEAVQAVSGLPQVQTLDRAFAGEHALEVHLPFLQTILGEFRLVPFVVGDADPSAVAEVLETLWGGAETLIVISSDLSHYLGYAEGHERDTRTTMAIEQLRPELIGYHDACGRNPINGLLTVAKRKGLSVETVDLRSSGDTAGPRDQVVGYGAYLIH